TGFSRALGDQDAKEFFGVEEDADVVGRFIRRWLTENERWASPKYLAGESYGTTRAGALVSNLTGRYNDVALNGVILVSAILDFETARGDLGTVGLLPTQAAIAWHHEKVDRDRWDNDFEDFLDDARNFAARELGPALMLGQGLPDTEHREVIREFSQYTGLSEDYLRRARMRVDVGRFMKELLRDEGLTVGRFDGRYTGVDSDDVGETAEADPSGYAMDSAYTGAMNDYLTRTLGVKMDRDYEVLSYDVNRSWKPGVSGGGSTGPGYTDVVPDLARGMRQNSEMRVLLASGYYDLATPFFAAEMSLQQPGVPQDRVERTYYPAGHMMYLHEPSLIQLGEDVRAFVEGD
ncbi:MAG: peptidase S10, partial [Pseudomonadota bacterium]